MKNKSTNSDDPLDREIDFSNARPNRFWLGVVDRSCIRLIDKDLAAVFPDNDSVNAALRTRRRRGEAIKDQRASSDRSA